MFATSEEQLVMHSEGKKHKRTLALRELTHAHLPHSAEATSGTHELHCCLQYERATLYMDRIQFVWLQIAAAVAMYDAT